MRIVFLLILFIVAIYFLLKKRRIDLFTISFFSSVMYFSPGIIGYVYYPFSDYKIELVNNIYIVYSIVILLNLLFAMFFDYFNSKRTIEINIKEVESQSILSKELILRVFIIISVGSLILMVITTGKEIFSPEKSILLDNVTRWRIVYTISTTIAIILSITFEKYKTFLFLIVIFLFDVYIGFRSSFVIAILSSILIFTFKKPPFKLITRWKVIFFGLFFSLATLVYKQLYVLIKLSEWELVKEKLKDPDFYLESIMRAEPSVTQLILNEVLRYDLQIGISHFKGIIYQFILFSNELGAEVTSFNSIFQPLLFPEFKWGMANNIWAEMYSAGGFFMLVLFVLLFNIINYFLNFKVFNTSNMFWRSVLLLSGIYWAFYIHRNDIQYMISLQKRVYIIGILGLFIAILLKMIILKRKVGVEKND